MTSMLGSKAAKHEGLEPHAMPGLYMYAVA